MAISQTVDIYCFLVSGFIHDVRSEFTDDVLELPVGPIFTVHLASEDGAHREFRNVIGKFTSYIV
jgi:hypothetical protein